MNLRDKPDEGYVGSMRMAMNETSTDTLLEHSGVMMLGRGMESR